MWHTYPCTGLPAPTGIQYILVFPLMIKLSHPPHPPHPLPPPISRLHMQTEVGAHKHIQSFAKVVAFTGNPPLETSCRYALMSSAYWLTRVHCRGFQGHSKSAVTSEHFKINLGHRVKRLHCRAVWLDGGEVLKNGSRIVMWMAAGLNSPSRKEKKNLWNNDWATPFNNGWAKQWNSTIYWTVISVPGYDSIHVWNLQLETPLSMSNQNIVSVKAYCSDNGALL